MARKWERMVEKNRKQANKRRQKYGQTPIMEAGKEAAQTFKGRSWQLPLVLIGFAVFFTLFQGQYGLHDSLYWFTIISYIFLGLMIFWLRRPYLKVGKTKLASRRFTGDRTVDVGDVEQITILKGYIIVQLKPRKSKWVFSRTMNMFDMAPMAEAVKEFAVRNGIPLKDERPAA